jgi:hypothetical protein
LSYGAAQGMTIGTAFALEIVITTAAAVYFSISFFALLCVDG